MKNTCRKVAQILLFVGLLLPIRLVAQPYYFFNGFPDAAQPSSWYNNAAGIGVGETAFIAGETYIVETGRTAVINSAWNIPNINIIVRNGALLVMNNDIITAFANITIESGGIFRVHNNPNINNINYTFNVNSNLYYTGTIGRNNTPEVPNFGVLNFNLIHDNSGGIELNNYNSTINGNVSVSSGTMRLTDAANLTFAGTTTIARGGIEVFSNFANSTLTCSGNFILGNGTELFLNRNTNIPTLNLQGGITFGGGNIRTNGFGELRIQGMGDLQGRLNLIQASTANPVLNRFELGRASAVLGLGTNMEIAAGGIFNVAANTTLNTNNFQLLLRGGTNTLDGTMNVNTMGLVEINNTAAVGGGTINMGVNTRLRTHDQLFINAVTYQDSSANLEYFGAGLITPGVEFPSPMQGSVVITNTNRVELNATKIVNGNLTVAPATPTNNTIFDIQPAVNLTLNGRIITQGNTPTIGVQVISGSNTVTIGGNDTTTIRNFSIQRSLSAPDQNPYLQAFIMDRPARLELSRDLVIDAVAGALLRLLRGRIIPPQTASGRVIMLAPSSAAIEGGSPTAYIQGPLQRSLSVTNVTYPYPIGTATEYMPMNIISPPSATVAPSIVITPISNSLGGSFLPPIFSLKDNRREWILRLGSITGIGAFNVQLSDTDLVASNVVLLNEQPSANYFSIGGILTGTSLIRSNTPITTLNNLSQQFSLRIGNTTPPPTVTRVAPRVVASGATISVEGTNFINVTRVQAATTTLSNFTVLSPTQLTTVLPSTIATANPNDNAVRVPIIVRAQGGTTASIDTLTYVLLPSIQSFSPAIGGRGTVVNIRGFRFSGSFSTTPTVTFGGIPAQSVTVLSSGELNAVVPLNATTGVITVSTPGGTVASVSIFTFVPPPRVTAIIPNIAKEGDIVVLRGSGFNMVSGVFFGGVFARSFTVNSPNQITAVVANGSSGTVTVRTVGGTIESTEEFTFAPPPRITNVTPRIIGTSDTFELQGTGFVGVREVRFTSASVDVTSLNVRVLSRTRMLVDAPRIAQYGELTINLTTAGGETSTNQTLTLVRSPEIFSFAPPSGTTGTLVQIFGANFLASTVSNVQIAGVTVSSLTVLSDSLIVVRAGRINTNGNVVVTAPGGIATARTTFANIAPPPVITSIEPAFAIAGTLVTVLGENFNDANVIRLVNARTQVNVTEFRVVTNGQISFIVPRNATTGNVEVRTSGGSGFSPLPLTFLPPPVVHVLEPPFGVIGSSVVLQGENLRGVEEIRIGDAPAINIRTESPTQLVFTLGSASSLGFNQTFTIVTTQGTTTLPEAFSVVTEQQLDSLALVSIYNRTGGTTWTRRERWLSLSPITQWQGVTVDSASRRVVQLSLPRNNMVGQFPLALQFLTRLRSLDWQENLLTGRIPPFIATLRNLDTLRLGQNRFSPSSLPDSLGNLTNLRVLNLSGDSLTGGIPRSLAQATNLVEVDMSNNQLADSVPQFLTNLTSLRVLRLNNNRLLGTIPTGFGTTTFAKNFFSTTDATPNLEELNLADNQLTGTIPTSISSLTNLRTLSLANNRLEGALTGALVQRLTTLATLNVGGNRLSGVIPSELGRLRNLRFLSLRRNQFTGTIPDSLAFADNLETLWLDNNLLAGGMTSTFERMTRLQRLDVSNNRLSFVPRLARIRPLNFVNLANNRLDFGTLEEVAQIDTIIIAPQDTIGERRTVRGIESLPLRLSIFTGGTSNRYQWFRETATGAVPVSPILRDSIFQFIFTQASSGTYSCRVTNVLPEMRSLTLLSRPVTLEFGGLPPPPTQIPQPIFPDDGSTFVPTNATLTWTFTTDASIYNVQLSTQPNFMPLLLEREVRDTVVRILALPHDQLIYWRVRGSNIAGVTPYSAASTFTTAPRNIDILATSVRFPRTPVGDEARSTLILTNTSTATLVVQSLRIQDGENMQDDENSFLLPDDVRGLTLRPNAEQRLEIVFTPRTVGIKRGTVILTYSPQNQLTRILPQTFGNLVVGQAIPIKVQDVDFDTVRVERSALTTMVIENKLPRNQQNIVRIRAIRPVVNSRDNAFSIQAFTPPVAVFPGDLTGVLVRCAPTLVGRPIALYTLEYEYSTGAQVFVDSIRVNVRAVAVLTPRDSLFLEVGIRPSRDSVPPGGRVDVELFIRADTSTTARKANETARIRRIIQNLGPRFFEGSIRFNPNVLSLVPNLYFEEITNATQQNDFQRVSVYVPRSLWNSADSLVIARIPFRVVSGNTNVTPLIIEDIGFGLGPNQRTTGQRAIFIDEPITVTAATQSRFIAGVCEAGGLRLTTTARAVNLTAVRPNPVKDAAELTYAVREDGLVVLDLIDMRGNVMQTLVQGDHAPGEYLLVMQTQNLPSGAYFLRLITPTSIKTQKINVVK